MNLRKKGEHYETLARQWLQTKGLNIVEQNYHCRFGEIDLIMLDQDYLCFIEVKFRRSNDFGGSAYSLPVSKQRKITRSALHYIEHHRVYRNHAMRFDALLIQGNDGDAPRFNWIQNAFYGE
jgi:putative endonuclease